jgi:cysteine synthase
VLRGIEPDGFVTVTYHEAIRPTRGLARDEEVLAGISSNANVAAALRLSSGPECGGTIALALNDSGLKYLSTDLWEPV